MPEINYEQLVCEEFAKAICRVKGWKEKPGFEDLVKAIKNGMWDEKFAIWLDGRQSVLDELTAAGMRDVVKNISLSGPGKS